MSSVPPQLSLVLYQQVLVCHSVGYRKNSLTSEFECWVIVKLWNKECRPRGGGGTLCLLCWAWKTPKPFVNCSEISSSIIHASIQLCSVQVRRWTSYAMACFDWPKSPYLTKTIVSEFPMLVVEMSLNHHHGRHSLRMEWLMSLSSMQDLYVWAWFEAGGTTGKQFDPMGIINHKCWHIVISVVPFSELKQSRGISALFPMFLSFNKIQL